MSIGERILKIRKEKKLTQESLAKKLYISRTKLSKIENDTSTINIDLAKRICETLDITLDYLVYGK